MHILQATLLYLDQFYIKMNHVDAVLSYRFLLVRIHDQTRLHCFLLKYILKLLKQCNNKASHAHLASLPVKAYTLHLYSKISTYISQVKSSGQISCILLPHEILASKTP